MILKLEVMGFAQCDKLLLTGGFPRKHARTPDAGYAFLCCSGFLLSARNTQLLWLPGALRG